MAAGWRDPVEFYATHAARFDAVRSRALEERGWLGAFAALLPPGGAVLDLGCGMGALVGAWLIAQDFRLTGVDAVPALLERARVRLPAGEWIEGDMRHLDLRRRFDGILLWDSLFHLDVAAQRACFATIATMPRRDARSCSTAARSRARARIPCSASRFSMPASPPEPIAPASPRTDFRWCAVWRRTRLAASAPSG